MTEPLNLTEAIEAGAIAFAYGDDPRGDKWWAKLPECERERYRRDAEGVLRAALPSVLNTIADRIEARVVSSQHYYEHCSMAETASLIRNLALPDNRKEL